MSSMLLARRFAAPLRSAGNHLLTAASKKSMGSVATSPSSLGASMTGRLGSIFSAATSRALGRKVIFSGTAAGLLFAWTLPHESKAWSAPEQVTEAATGINFDSVHSTGQQLLGTGCRYKFSFIKIYAVGIYADASAGIGSGDIFKNLLESMSNKTVIIKMSYGISSQKLTDSLNEAFRPRLAQPGRSDKGMAEFCDVISKATSGSCAAGDEIELQCVEGKVLKVKVVKAQGGGVATGKVEDPDICYALLDTYLGAGSVESVSPTLKKSISSFYSK